MSNIPAVNELITAINFDRFSEIEAHHRPDAVFQSFRGPTLRDSVSIADWHRELLRDYADRLDENRRLAHFNRVETSVRQLLQMLDDMLVVAQMETGHLEFKPEPINLERFFQGVIDEFQAMHSEIGTLTSSGTDISGA